MNFNIRKTVLEYDDVLNKQREVIYAERRRVLEGEDLAEQARDWIADVLVEEVDQYAGEDLDPIEWDLSGLVASLRTFYPLSLSEDQLTQTLDGQPATRDDLLDRLEDDAIEAYERQEANIGPENVREWERYVLLQVVDLHWREHLYAMDYLREGIHLRALAQLDPLSAYRTEGHQMFDETMSMIRREFVRYMFHIETTPPEEREAAQPARVDYTYQAEPIQGFQALEAAVAQDPALSAVAAAEPQPVTTAMPVVEQRIVPPEERIGRNDPCWCGSGLKYKKCHGAAV
jgi:preprotein translocase subunit SecA